MRRSPFHARTALLNPASAWTVRNGVVVAARYRDAGMEAAAARLSVAVVDISWRWRIELEGGRVHDLVRRLFTRDATTLEPGHALKALWLSDAGGVRGAGVVARVSADAYRIVSVVRDAEWFAAAARWYGVELHEQTEQEGGLAVIGPYAAKLLARLGLDGAFDLLSFRIASCKGIAITLSRFGEHNGYELWCPAADAPALWDVVMAAGEPFALIPAGQEAVDTLDLEAGVPRPGRDYDGAATPGATAPLAAELRLVSLIDPEHPAFNGRIAALAAAPRRKLLGIALDSERPAPFTPVVSGTTSIGQTLGSRYSSVLRRAIALAQIDEAHAKPGAVFQVMLPPAHGLLPTPAAVRVVDLPFLPPPDVLAP